MPRSSLKAFKATSLSYRQDEKSAKKQNQLRLAIYDNMMRDCNNNRTRLPPNCLTVSSPNDELPSVQYLLANSLCLCDALLHPLPTLQYNVSLAIGLLPDCWLLLRTRFLSLTLVLIQDLSDMHLVFCQA